MSEDITAQDYIEAIHERYQLSYLESSEIAINDVTEERNILMNHAVGKHEKPVAGCMECES